MSRHGDFYRPRAAMPLELGAIGGTWPVAASLAAAVTVRGVAAGRRRTALNEALHELRRPLQALALSARGGGAALDSSLRMAAVALERLDREINGDGVEGAPHAELVPRRLVEEAASRWGARAAARSASVGVRWEAGEATVRGERAGLERALDNLIANAIEHGGPRIVVGAERAGEALRLSVSDSGRALGSRRRAGARRRARLTGRRRRGHGLRIVRRVAAEHGGAFRLRISVGGAVATLELPLVGGDG